MRSQSPIVLALTLAFTAGFVSPALSAQDADAASETSAALTPLSLDVADFKVNAQFPCAQPDRAPAGDNGSEAHMCVVGDAMFVLAVAVVGDEATTGPMQPNFDTAFNEVEESSDTVSLERIEIGGRRTMIGERGPDPKFGTIRAVELNEDIVVYAVTLSRPGLKEALSDADKARMRSFTEALEIAP
ncbi:MAG: hypothetical protein AAGH57_14800 [Pseudomonadota bacterium]